MKESMRDRFHTVLAGLLDEDPRIAVVLADIGVSRLAESGAVRAHPDRVVNVGIREQAMIGVAAGMALEGLRPVVHSYAPFLVQRPYEQIKLDLGHQGVGAILVSIGASYDAAGEGRTHHAPEDVVLLSNLPGWEIHVPGHPDEVELLLRRAARGSGPVYLRLAEDSNDEALAVGAGGWVTVRHGTGATVVAVGPTLDRVLQATTALDVTVLYAATVRPFDRATLRHAARHPDVVLVEPYLAGTSAPEISRALDDRPHRLLSLGVALREHRHYGERSHHDAGHGLDVRGLRASIADFLSRGAPGLPRPGFQSALRRMT